MKITNSFLTPASIFQNRTGNDVKFNNLEPLSLKLSVDLMVPQNFKNKTGVYQLLPQIDLCFYE